MKIDHVQPTHDQLNDLYWNSDRTIDEIIGDAGIGRNTLYGSIRPVTVGMTCPTCAGDMVFANRTDRASGVATCENCGLERTLTDLEQGGRTVMTESVGPMNGEGGSVWTRWRGELSEVAPERAAMIAGAAALGLMVGAAAVRAIRH